MTRQNTPGLKISEVKMQDQVRKLQRGLQLRDWENGPVIVVRVYNRHFSVLNYV